MCSCIFFLEADFHLFLYFHSNLLTLKPHTRHSKQVGKIVNNSLVMFIFCISRKQVENYKDRAGLKKERMDHKRFDFP